MSGLVSSIADLPRHVGATVTVRGWVQGKRSSGKIAFLVLRDGSGSCQSIVEPVHEAAFAAAKELGQESSVLVTGEVRADERSVGGVELAVSAIDVLQAVSDYPISRKAHGVEFLMNHRHLWLRSERQAAILRIRHTIIQATRRFFDEDGFTLIDTPIFQEGAGEGASTLFTLDYFGNDEVALAQTGQLYLESAALALGKVYCFGPTFRAEKSKTRRHLTEFWMVEPEVAFAELPDVEALAENLICAVVGAVLERHRDDLALLGRDIGALEAVRAPFPRITYSEAVELLRSDALHEKLQQQLEADRARLADMQGELAEKEAQSGQSMKAWKKEKLEQEIRVLREALRELEVDVANRPGHLESARNFAWGNDLGGDDETILSNEFDRPLIVTRYPREVKAFYMKRAEDDPRVVLNLDVLAPEGYGEIVGGSQREDDLEVLLERMADEGMDTEPYAWYLDLRRYGSVPHGGFGLGIERTVAWICGLKHVRETIPFARLMGRMYP